MVEPKKNQVDYDRLSDLSGESGVRRIRYVVPVLKFNGNTGKFSLLLPDPDADKNFTPKEIPATEIEGVILKVRRALTAYEKAQDGTAISYFTNEHNSWNEPLILFERRKGYQRPKMIDQGSTKQLRENFPSLKLKQNLYFLYNNQVVKLGVRGKGLSSLFEYYNSFDPKEHLFEYLTQITRHQEKSEGGLEYFVMDFKRGKKADIKKVSNAIEEVALNLSLQDKSYQAMPRPEGGEEEEEKEEEEKPEAKPEKSEENEIQVKDIPF